MIDVGSLPYPAFQARKPLVGDSPAISAATYPDGTPLSLTPVVGRRFNIIGEQANGTDNAANVAIGTEGVAAEKRPFILAPGSTGITILETDNEHLIDLADYFISGTDGDGVKWIRVS